jgi:hypothetical protein
VFRELRKWAPNRADPRRGARISERVAQHRTWGSRAGEPFVRGVRYTFVTPLLDTPRYRHAGCSIHVRYTSSHHTPRYRHAFVCLAWGVRHLSPGERPPRPPPALVASLVVVRPRECSRRSCPTPAPRPSAPPRAPRRPARARGMTRGPRPRSGSRCRCRVGAVGPRWGMPRSPFRAASRARRPRPLCTADLVPGG